MVAGFCCAADAQEVSSLTVRHAGIETLLDVLACVESNNDPNAVGIGPGPGPLSDPSAYWEDGTRLLGVNWPYREAFNPDKARCVVRAYLLHHGANKTIADMARIHNGGPSGHRRRSTLCYAQRVSQLLAQKVEASRL